SPAQTPGGSSNAVLALIRLRDCYAVALLPRSIIRRTCAADHVPPRAARIERSLRASAIFRRLAMPLARRLSITGRRSAARWSALALRTATLRDISVLQIATVIPDALSIRRPDPVTLLCCSERRLRAFRNGLGLVLGNRRKNVDREFVDVRHVTGHEGHLPLHQRGDERDIPGEPVKLGDEQSGAMEPAQRQRLLELGPIAALATLHLDHLGDQPPLAAVQVVVDVLAL